MQTVVAERKRPMAPDDRSSMTDAQRARFDGLVERVLESMPGAVLAMLDEAPLVVTDLPSRELLQSLADEGVDVDPDAPHELAGLHTGHAITERSVEASGDLPSTIDLYRVGVIETAGGWEGPDADARIMEEIRITILHELGHEMGLDEDDLDALGYG